MDPTQGTNLFTPSSVSGVEVALIDNLGQAYFARTSSAPANTMVGVFAHGCKIVASAGNGVSASYENVGSTSVPDIVPEGSRNLNVQSIKGILLNVNLKAAPGTHFTAYTVPAGRTFILTEVYVYGVIVDTVVAGQYGFVSLGSEDGAAQDWFDGAQIPPLAFAGIGLGITEFAGSQGFYSLHSIFTGGQNIGLTISTSAVATTLTANFYFEGYLI